MYTLFDFITHIKGIEYILAILFIAVYILYVEVLKPRPFATLILALRETRDHLCGMGWAKVVINVAKIIAMPVLGLIYLLALPFVFLYAVGSAVASKFSLNVRGGMSFGWRPAQAYLAGRENQDAPPDGKNAPQETRVNP